MHEHQALTSGWQLLAAYNRLIENMHEMGHYHFEMLTLGYGAYLTFRDLCAELFPSIDNQTITRMVSGQELVLFRPDAELRKLAALGHELGSARASSTATPTACSPAWARATPAGAGWRRSRRPRIRGSGTRPARATRIRTARGWTTCGSRSRRCAATSTGSSGRGDRRCRRRRCAPRASGWRTSTRTPSSSDEERESFRSLLELSRTVYPYVENHNFYVEHWHHTIFFNKVRELGAVLVTRGVLADAEDIFYLHRFEIPYAIYELGIDWAIDGDGASSHWREEVEVRREILARLQEWSPPPALGPPPEQITESYTIMLFGITTEGVADWLADGDEREDGVAARSAASPPRRAWPRASRAWWPTPRGSTRSQQGEILVSRCTTPSWAPIFGRVAAAVADIGGVMSHAAIVAREYGLPAVVGTGLGTQRIQTGQRIRVDGNRGVVELIEEGRNERADQDRIYARAGWGQRIRRGSRPAIVVVDLTNGFTDPQYATGSELTRGRGGDRAAARGRARARPADRVHHHRLRGPRPRRRRLAAEGAGARDPQGGHAGRRARPAARRAGRRTS